MLIGAGGPTLLYDPLLWRVVQRLLSPQAQIEGVDSRLNDPVLIDRAASARAFVMLLPPLGNQGNSLYSVHPRRNDRFLTARPALKALFPEVDFTEFDFTGHMLGTLAATCAERFAETRQILRQNWLEKLSALLVQLPEQGLLLHLPGPAWLPLPVSELARCKQPVLAVDCADRADAANRLRTALGSTLAPLYA
ncbi:MAG: hypothetical protein JJU15_05600 [Pararhodobacter sp.]|nr:hypothetical protein [Pararhodobacter sp.]